ncbi:MAG: hypothetical protein DI570_14380 [Phenylobacterium zucineum]|nr:MAG: hypothetical protein DI570_14380 [Phenylobacterium zucineum]
MAWRRLGLVYAPGGEADWLISHASVPFAEPIEGGLHRIWFSPRDRQNRSHVAWIVVDLERPQQVLEHSPGPILGCGPMGAFDDCGAMMSWLAAGRLYYIGWNTRSTVPYQVSIGLAESDGHTLRRVDGPILERSPADPWFCSNPCVLPDGRRWRMWYLSGLGWNEIGGQWSPSYRICTAVSADGRDWTDRGQVAIDLEGNEYALARPSVLRDGDGWLMWFCARTRERPYRLAAARSADGITWTRAPELAGLEPAADGWDSEMVAYPHVFEHGGRRWMLYCGNGFGRSGFGLAVWE